MLSGNLIGDLNATLSKWCPRDKCKKAGQDIDTFTITSGYTQMIKKYNDAYIALFNINNSKLLSDVGVE